MIRLSLGLTSLTISLLFAAHALGLVPDRDAAELRGRKTLCESLAISCSLAAQRDDPGLIEATIRSVAGRNPEIESAAVRLAGGSLLATAGDHARRWGTGPGKTSTPTQMRVPIVLGEKPWGTIEVRFRPLQTSKIAAFLGGSMLPLVAFVGSVGMLTTQLFLRSALRGAGRGRGRAGVMPERVRDTLNTVMEGVLVLDRDQRIALANDSFAATIGVPAEALKGRRASDLCIDRTRAENIPWLRAITEGKPQRGAILTLQTQSKAFRKVSVNSTSIVGDDGDCRGALATFDDLTPVENKNAQLRKLLRRLRRAQADLRKARDAAEAANRAKSEFLANVSHEIRTPMNAILGMTEAALDSPLDDSPRDCLEIVKTAGESLLSIINDILDLGKIEAGMFALDAFPFAPSTVVADALKTLSFRAEQKGLALTLDVQPDVPARLIGDGPRLRQIVLNLVGNALKFTETGSIAVGIAIEPGTLDDDTEELHLSVADTGIGIASDKLQTIFQPFTQADGSITRRFGGTGLGLTISYRLTEMMAGRIWVESEPGQGSVFHVVARFKLDRAEERPSNVAPSSPSFEMSTIPRLNILLVDDNAFNQKVGTHKLKKMGHEVWVASSGNEALSMLASARFELVFMDIQMKDMDGLEATRRVRQREQSTTRRTPILAMTARAMKEDRQRCLDAGMDGFVSKPIRDEELLQALQSVRHLLPGALPMPTVAATDPVPSARPESPAATAPSFNLAKSRERVGGNLKLLDELIGTFREDCPTLLAEIEAAVRQGNSAELCQAAHTLKSMLLFFEATTASQCALRLETMGRNFELAGASDVFSQLAAAVDHVLSVFTEQEASRS